MRTNYLILFWLFPFIVFGQLPDNVVSNTFKYFWFSNNLQCKLDYGEKFENINFDELKPGQIFYNYKGRILNNCIYEITDSSYEVGFHGKFYNRFILALEYYSKDSIENSPLKGSTASYKDVSSEQNLLEFINKSIQKTYPFPNNSEIDSTVITYLKTEYGDYTFINSENFYVFENHMASGFLPLRKGKPNGGILIDKLGDSNRANCVYKTVLYRNDFNSDKLHFFIIQLNISYLGFTVDLNNG